MALCGMLLKQQLLLLLRLIVLASTKASLQPNSSCGNVSCGNVNIPYPFGTKEGCYRDESFLITCDNTSETTPKPFLSHTEVLNISLQEGELLVSTPIGPNENLSKFPLSVTRNKFTVVGCNTSAFIKRSFVNDYVTGCISLCNQYSVVNGSCFGVGCCQTPIPKGVTNYHVEFQALGENNSNRSNFGFVVEEGAFNFSLDPENLKNRKTTPVVLDWAVGNETCPDAKRNSESYACKAENSICHNSTNGPGYLCKCSSGFEGNPYLIHGCQDINECEKSNPCNKNKICHNFDGDYKCSCPKGYHEIVYEGVHENGTDLTGCRRAGQLKIALCISLTSLLVLLLGGFWIYCELKKRKLIKLRENFFQQNGGLLLKKQLFDYERSIATTKIFTAEELKKATNNYDESKILGQGGSGTVYKGVLSDNRVVAIKKSKIRDQSQIEQFINEVNVLTQINHRNVVKLFGCCLETEVPLLVYEFITNGTLFDHVHDKSLSSLLSWEKRLKIVTETAGALAYLHSATSMLIIHRDVKTANILLDDNYTTKVADFGASRLVPLDKMQLTTLVQGTWGYLDPEYLQTSNLTEKSDVYSFGVVMAELLTGKKVVSFERPEMDRNLAIFFVSSIKEDRLFQIIEDHIINEGNIEQLKEVANLAKRCLTLGGEDRPSMKEVAAELERLKKMEKQPSEDTDVYANKAEYLPSATSQSSDIDVGTGGSTTTSTTAEYDTTKDQLQKLVDNGRKFLAPL